MAHRAPGPDGAPLHDLTGHHVYPADVYTTLRFYRTGDATMDRQAEAVVLRHRGRPASLVRVFRAVPRRVRTIHRGDWVTVVQQYAEQHAAGGEPMVILAAWVPASSLHTNGDSLLEWGYNGPRIRV